MGFIVCATESVLAQSSGTLGISQHVVIEEPVEEGDLISHREGKYVLSDLALDNSIVGVVTYKPAVSIITSFDDNSVPVVSTGEASVRVSNINGSILKGDIIGASGLPGIGMKLTTDGYGLGIALEDFSSDEDSIGMIKVLLNPQYVSVNSETADSFIPPTILDNFNLSALKQYDSMSEVLKLGAGFTLAAATFGFGFLTFRKIAVRAVDATGRNPLASKVIMFNLILNSVLTLVIIGGGLALSYLIIKI